MKKISNRGALAILTLGLAFAVSGCGSDGSDDSARVSALEADLNGAQKALSALRAEYAADVQWWGLHFENRVGIGGAEETRAADGSSLTIEFSGDHADRPDIVLHPAAANPPPQLGDWQGERFESSPDPEADDKSKTVAVLYRTPWGANFLQYGWWQTEMTDSAGRSWFDSHGRLISARGDDFSPIRDIAGLQGQATFEGHAAGIYAIWNPAEGQNDSGEFTADASLAVDFEDGSATGTIDNFVAAGQQKGWTVSLLGGEFRPGQRAGSFRGAVRWTISADQATPGESGANWWTGSFLEDRTDETMGGVGTFNAQYTTIGRLTGAFGVKEQ